VVDNDDHAKPATVPAGDAPVESYRPLAANVDTDALRLEISRGAFDAENPHRKGGWTRTIARPGIETATLLDDVWEQYPYARDAVTRVLDSLTGGLGVVKALDDLYDVLDDALAAITICERVEMHACFHAGGFDMYGDACPLVWRDDALAAPAGNDAATKFVSRRIAELQRDGYYVEAVRLMDEIPPPDDPGDDALAVEWATVHEPSIHRFNETLAYAHYAEHVTGYPMGGAL